MGWLMQAAMISLLLGGEDEVGDVAGLRAVVLRRPATVPRAMEAGGSARDGLG